jgi:ribonuclease T2
MVLAISWQPGFCETRPKVRECRSQTSDRFDSTHFSLHGLWPQPGSAVYCGVDGPTRSKDKPGQWQKLEGLGLSDELKQEVWKVMPGSRSFLHRHEWIKHGTCYSSSPEVYFADSVALMQQINASSVQELFEASIGKLLDGNTIRASFDRAFGPGVGKRVRISCKRDGGRTIITELTLGLSGRITDKPDIGTLALAANTTKPGCPSGIVDPAGFQ